MFQTVSLYTLGCRLNQAETAVLSHAFANSGFTIVDFDQPADLVVINTCTVTENGDADTRRIVNRIRRHTPQSQIALIGCQAEIQGETLLRDLAVNFVVGNGAKMSFPQLLRKQGEKTPALLLPKITREPFSVAAAEVDPRHTRANLKIQDGCDFFCSYCEIPYARGRARSREFDDLMRGARDLLQAGYREIVLTGINVGTYSYQDKTIADVLAALEALPDLQRLRISSIEPTTIPYSLIDRMAEKGKFCRHLHLPMQHGHDQILEAMNRRYRIADYCAFVQQTVQRVPDICIGADVMVGFPGETQAHFEASVRILEELPLAYFHVFSYSDRSRNQSRLFSQKVAKNEIQKRSKVLRDLSNQKRMAYLNRMCGKTESVLFEQSKEDWWSGLTDNFVRVHVRSQDSLKNCLLPVELDKRRGLTVIGKI